MENLRVEVLLDKIYNTLRRSNTRRQQDINLASDFTPNEPFQLYVGVSGTVIGKAGDGSAVNRVFTAGYHPFDMISITASGTTATGLAAMFIEK